MELSSPESSGWPVAFLANLTPIQLCLLWANSTTIQRDRSWRAEAALGQDEHVAEAIQLCPIQLFCSTSLRTFRGPAAHGSVLCNNTAQTMGSPLAWLLWHCDFYSWTEHWHPACPPGLSVLRSLGQFLDKSVGTVILGRTHTAVG